MATDEALYQRIRAGDREAFDRLYDRYQKPVFRFLLSLLGNAQDAEEVFHEAWIAVLKSDELAFAQASFRAWLYQVARNGALNRLRARRRFQHAVRELPVEAGGESESEDAERAARLARELANLPSQMKQLFEWRREGRSYQQMAEALEVPVGTIKSRMHAVVHRLRTRLKK